MQGIDNEEQKTANELQLLNKAKNWHPKGKKPVFVTDAIEFNKFCFLMEEHTTSKVKELTILEFYSLKELIKEKHQANVNG